jgi:hypothetical protein
MRYFALVDSYLPCAARTKCKNGSDYYGDKTTKVCVMWKMGPIQLWILGARTKNDWRQILQDTLILVVRRSMVGLALRVFMPTLLAGSTCTSPE